MNFNYLSLIVAFILPYIVSLYLERIRDEEDTIIASIALGVCCVILLQAFYIYFTP